MRLRARKWLGCKSQLKTKIYRCPTYMKIFKPLSLFPYLFLGQRKHLNNDNCLPLKILTIRLRQGRNEVEIV